MKRNSNSGKCNSGTIGHDDLREIQERYSFIVNAYGEMMTLINRDYVYELVNDSWCRTFGKSREDFIGKTVSEIWGDKKFETEIKSKIDQCLKGKIFTEEDSFIIAGGGDTVVLEIGEEDILLAGVVLLDFEKLFVELANFGEFFGKV